MLLIRILHLKTTPFTITFPRRRHLSVIKEYQKFGARLKLLHRLQFLVVTIHSIIIDLMSFLVIMTPTVIMSALKRLSQGRFYQLIGLFL